MWNGLFTLGALSTLVGVPLQLIQTEDPDMLDLIELLFFSACVWLVLIAIGGVWTLTH